MSTIHETALAIQGFPFREFDTSREAYDASNCELDTGTIIHVARDRVVGLSWAWPVAVTEETGGLHSVKDDCNLDRLLTDMKITPEHVKQAVAEAKRRGYPIATWAKEFE